MRNIPRVPLFLGFLILIAAIANFFIPKELHFQMLALILICFALIALSMNYTKEGKERNAWDVWFFAMPGVIVALFFVGSMGEEHFPEVWKWVAIALGAAAGLESLSAVLKALRKPPE